MTVSTSTACARNKGATAAATAAFGGDLVGDTTEFDSIDNTVSTSMGSTVWGGPVIDDDDDATGNVDGAGSGGGVSTAGDDATVEPDSMDNTVSISMGSKDLGRAVVDDDSTSREDGVLDPGGDFWGDSIDKTVSTSTMSCDVVDAAWTT